MLDGVRRAAGQGRCATRAPGGSLETVELRPGVVLARTGQDRATRDWFSFFVCRGPKSGENGFDT